tara:strand:- start:488 stop:742 length:255 start_codon:yes stop_codon:yes gene_type:complete
MKPKLREFIEYTLAEAKIVTLRGQNRNDLSMAILWIRNNKKLKSAGAIEKTKNDDYVARIKVKGTKSEASALIKDRFGSFIRVS